jgi:multicomponent Na+:H+ antiporter subunit F
MNAEATGFLGTVVDITLVALGVSMLLALVRLVRGPSLPDRVVALDLIMLLAVGTIAAFDIATSEPAFLDVAAVVALITFLGTVALARYIERGAAS